jgi:glycerol-3-phosphate dehydrogenase
VKKEFQVSMPILESVYAILYEKAAPKKEMKKLTDCLD